MARPEPDVASHFVNCQLMLTVHRGPGALRIAPSGDLDLSTGNAFVDEVVRQLESSDGLLVLDFAGSGIWLTGPDRRSRAGRLGRPPGGEGGQCWVGLAVPQVNGDVGERGERGWGPTAQRGGERPRGTPRLGRPYLEVSCLAQLWFATRLPPFAVSRRHSEEAVALAEEYGWGTASIVAPDLITLACVMVWMGEFDNADSTLQRAGQALQADAAPDVGTLFHLDRMSRTDSST
jgi:hypothetical protein